MSKLNHTITIEPTIFIRDNPVETLPPVVHECPVCHGSGEHKDYRVSKDPVVEPCRVCGGSGKVIAKVTISWEKQQ